MYTYRISITSDIADINGKPAAECELSIKQETDMEKDMNKEKLEMLIRRHEVRSRTSWLRGTVVRRRRVQAKDSATHVRKILEAAKLAALRVEVLANEFKKECEE